MVAAFPLAKIGLLLMKQLSKPLAHFIKNEAKKHPVIRKYIIIPTGRVYQWIEKLATSKPQEARISDEEAVELGANAIGEIVLFGLLTIILIAEINRQGDKKAMKQKTKDEEVAHLVETVMELAKDVDHLKKSLTDLHQTLEIASDVVALEDQRHFFAIHDANFLDFFNSGKRNIEEHLDLDPIFKV